MAQWNPAGNTLPCMNCSRLTLQYCDYEKLPCCLSCAATYHQGHGNLMDLPSLRHENLYCSVCGAQATQVCTCTFPIQLFCDMHMHDHMSKPSQVRHVPYPLKAYTCLTTIEGVRAFRARDGNIDFVLMKIQEGKMKAEEEKKKMVLEFDYAISQLVAAKEGAVQTFDNMMITYHQAENLFQEDLDRMRYEPGFQPKNRLEQLALMEGGSQVQTELANMMFIAARTYLEVFSQCYQITQMFNLEAVQTPVSAPVMETNGSQFAGSETMYGYLAEQKSMYSANLSQAASTPQESWFQPDFTSLPMQTSAASYRVAQTIPSQETSVPTSVPQPFSTNQQVESTYHTAQPTTQMYDRRSMPSAYSGSTTQESVNGQTQPDHPKSQWNDAVSAARVGYRSDLTSTHTDERYTDRQKSARTDYREEDKTSSHGSTQLPRYGTDPLSLFLRTSHQVPAESVLTILSLDKVLYFNLETHSKRKMNLSKPLECGEGMIWGQLSSDTVLCTGGGDREVVYIIRGNEVIDGPSLLRPRGFHSLVLYNSRAYVFGGVCGGTPMVCCEWFNPETGMWLELENMHHPRYCVTPAMSGESVYFVGGYMNSIEVFSIPTQSFLLFPLTENLQMSVCFPKDNDIIVVSGTRLYRVTTRSKLSISFTGEVSIPLLSCSSVPILFKSKWYVIDRQMKGILAFSTERRVLEKLWDLT